MDIRESLSSLSLEAPCLSFHCHISLWLSSLAAPWTHYGLVCLLAYVLTNEETRRNLDALHGFMAKYGALGVFFFSITPLPDDVYIVPMGMIKLPFWRFFTANLAGKITLSVFVAYASRAYFSEVSTLFGGESTLALIAAISVTVILSLILLRADWILAVRVAKARGLAGLIRSFPAILRKKKENSREE